MNIFLFISEWQEEDTESSIVFLLVLIMKEIPMNIELVFKLGEDCLYLLLPNDTLFTPFNYESSLIVKLDNIFSSFWFVQNIIARNKFC